MRTLVIVAHMDDEALSNGALIAKRVRQGAEVYVLAVYGRVYDYGHETVSQTYTNLYGHFRRAQRVLGYQHEACLNLREGEPAQVGHYAVLEPIEGGLLEFAPDEVIIPGAKDLNQDHKFLNQVCKIALRPGNLGSVRRVLQSHALDSDLSEPDYFVPCQPQDLAVKLEAIAQYTRDRKDGCHPRSPENIKAMHRVWGSKCGVEFAEAYTLHLMIDP